MKNLPVLIVFFILSLAAAYADTFSPTILKLSADPIIMYEFAGRELVIPVEVSGTPAGVVFCVFTEARAIQIPYTINGYLGWHHVNKVDTCIYFSTLYDFDTGPNVVTWDGKDQDGGVATVGCYTYYLWGFDNKSEKQFVSRHISSRWKFDFTTNIREVDENGNPLSNPIWYRPEERWIIGNDPEDESLLETSTIQLETVWEHLGDPVIDSKDMKFYYISVGNGIKKQGSIQKLKWVPNGVSEIQTDWGENDGYASFFSTAGGGSAGVATDGTHLFTTDENHTASDEPDADFYIYDMDGCMIADIDLSPWWSSYDDFESGGQMNGGPNNFEQRNGFIFLNCHCNCLNQMVDPKRYLESGEYDDFFVWSNGNGDYVLDHNFEETAQNLWVCNDYNVGPYKDSISADDNYFTAVNAYDVGVVSFSLLAPDGTGLGYFAFSGEDAGWKTGLKLIDSGTPYDGLYCDDQCPPYGTDHYITPPTNDGIFYLAHDSIKGVITAGADYFGPPGIITVISPNGGETLTAGSDHEITWTVSGTHRIPEHLRIDYSADGGNTWKVLKNIVRASDICFTWTVPDIESDRCLVKLSDARMLDPPDVSDNVFAIIRDVGIDNIKPLSFSLKQNYPNPFNPATTIPFTLAKRSRVILTVYNTAGKKVTVLADDILPAGEHSAKWDTGGFSSGIYFYRLKAGLFEETRKMTLVR